MYTICIIMASRFSRFMTVYVPFYLLGESLTTPKTCGSVPTIRSFTTRRSLVRVLRKKSGALKIVFHPACALESGLWRAIAPFIPLCTARSGFTSRLLGDVCRTTVRPFHSHISQPPSPSRPPRRPSLSLTATRHHSSFRLRSDARRGRVRPGDKVVVVTNCCLCGPKLESCGSFFAVEARGCHISLHATTEESDPSC